MISKTPSFKDNLRRVFKISVVLAPLVIIALLFLAIYPTLKPFFSKQFDWGEPRVFSQGDNPSWPFSYLALMKYDANEYLDDSGNMQIVPQRLVFLSQDELHSPYSNSIIKLGTGSVTVPNDDLTMNLQAPELQACFQQLCVEYSTSSKEHSKAEVHFAAIPQQNGDILYVMAKLIDDYAFRSVWTVDDEGNPTPVAFNWTNDRNGYRYRQDFTRHDILFKDLYLPPK